MISHEKISDFVDRWEEMKKEFEVVVLEAFDGVTDHDLDFMPNGVTEGNENDRRMFYEGLFCGPDNILSYVEMNKTEETL